MSEEESEYEYEYEEGVGGEKLKIGRKRLPGRHSRYKQKDGEVWYKAINTDGLSQSFQLGLRVTIASIAARKERDIICPLDFDEIEYRKFPAKGSYSSPAHNLRDFKFSSYAPYTFRKFREKFGISPAEFMMSICDKPLVQKVNPGASGSIFFYSHDDTFVIKTVSKTECNFLLRFLPAYFTNLVQNERTLLTKFLGLFSYQCAGGATIRFVVMNNMLPSRLLYHQIFDLKGSTFHRVASEKEKNKRTPIYKDQDFLRLHPNGLRFSKDTHEELKHVLSRDVLVLASNDITDYSMLVGIHRKGVDHVLEKRIFVDSDVIESKPSDNGKSPATKATSKLNTKSISFEIKADPKKAKLEPGKLQLPTLQLQPRTHSPTPSISSSITSPNTLKISGCTGDRRYLNAYFEQSGDRRQGKPLFKSTLPVAAGNGTVSGSNLFMYYNLDFHQWVVSLSRTRYGVTPLLLSRETKAESPWEVPSGHWMLLAADGTHQRDTAVFVTKATEEEIFGSGDSKFQSIEEEDIYSEGYECEVYDSDTDEWVAAVVFLGIIDVLQRFRWIKKIEHKYKTIVQGNGVSVQPPRMYQRRLETFLNASVLTTVPLRLMKRRQTVPNLKATLDTDIGRPERKFHLSTGIGSKDAKFSNNSNGNSSNSSRTSSMRSATARPEAQKSNQVSFLSPPSSPPPPSSSSSTPTLTSPRPSSFPSSLRPSSSTPRPLSSASLRPPLLLLSRQSSSASRGFMATTAI